MHCGFCLLRMANADLAQLSASPGGSFAFRTSNRSHQTNGSGPMDFCPRANLAKVSLDLVASDGNFADSVCRKISALSAQGVSLVSARWPFPSMWNQSKALGTRFRPAFRCG